jgi:hypothetical protein
MAIGMAATAAGTYAQNEAAKKSQNAINSAREAERIRQRGLQSQSDALFSESLSKQGAPAYADQAKASMNRRVAAQTENLSHVPASTPIASQAGSPRIVSDESSQRVGDASTSAAMEGRNKAIAAGFGDTGIGNALVNMDYGRRQGMIADAMGGSTRALTPELEAAQARGATLGGWGKGLVGLGSMFNMYGAMQPKDKTIT